MNTQQLVVAAGSVIGITGEPTVPFYGIKTSDDRIWNPLVNAEHTVELAMRIGIASNGTAASIKLDDRVISEIADPEEGDTEIARMQRSVVLVAARLAELGITVADEPLQEVYINMEFSDGEINKLELFEPENAPAFGVEDDWE